MKGEMEKYFDRLWPICRSITGDGLRESLEIIKEIIPLSILEIPSGTDVYDWKVPKEWNIKDAWIITPDGRKIADFSENNLHILNYSVAVNKKLGYEELKNHVHTIPEMPDAIPYVTSYYRENWGFCMSEEQWNSLPESGEYEVFIDSSLENGSMSIGHLVLKGNTDEEILLSTYLCHPSMANNELSGPLALAFLYNLIKEIPNKRYTYRFVFAPETIGVIAYLHQFGEKMKKNTRAGYVFTCCGDSGDFTYKRSKDENDLCNRVAEHLLKHSSQNYEVIDFAVGGSDERQYCSPGFNMPVGSLMRSMYQKYKEYHTSLDNKAFMSFSALGKTVHQYFDMVRLLEFNRSYYNKVQYCEPQLGKRGLYPDSILPGDAREALHNMLHLLSYADGHTDLIEIAEKRGCCALELIPIINDCIEKGILLRQKP